MISKALKDVIGGKSDMQINNILSGKYFLALKRAGFSLVEFDQEVQLKPSFRSSWAKEQLGCWGGHLLERW